MPRFHDPTWLLLLLACVPLAALALRWFVSMTSVRRWSAVVARTTLVALIAGALAGAASIQTTDELAASTVGSGSRTL